MVGKGIPLCKKLETHHNMHTLPWIVIDVTTIMIISYF